MNKYQAYRKRCKDEGKCPHCGKPCRPFFECLERRLYKAELRRRNNRFARLNWPEKMKFPRGPRRLWTDHEDSQLNDFLKADMPFKTICKSLERSPWGIIARARKIGLGKFNEFQSLLHVLSRELDQ